MDRGEGRVDRGRDEWIGGRDEWVGGRDEWIGGSDETAALGRVSLVFKFDSNNNQVS